MISFGITNNYAWKKPHSVQNVEQNISNLYSLLKELNICHKSQFSNTRSLKPDGVNLWYFKLWFFDPSEFIVWNIKGLQHWVVEMKGPAMTPFLYLETIIFTKQLQWQTPHLSLFNLYLYNLTYLIYIPWRQLYITMWVLYTN